MALSSSFISTCNWRFNVFLSFHWPDVRVSFLSYLRTQFERNRIVMFNDQEIERSQAIKPELTRAIQESRISIVLLSQNYASSSLCLNELVEILKCKETAGQIVMTVFNEVDPSDVSKQTGEFGKAFKETCEGKTETEIQSWTEALTHVATIEGEHSLNWVNEADMSEKIATNVSNKLNATPSRDFENRHGVSIWTDEIERSCEFESSKAFANESDTSERKDVLICKAKEDRNVEAKMHTDCWSLLLFCLENLDIVISIASLIWERS